MLMLHNVSRAAEEASRVNIPPKLEFFLLHSQVQIRTPQCEAAIMTPYPDSVATKTSTPEVQPAQAEDSTLPGMKRGIAIGVACSVGIIMVAILAFFAYRRRKQQATKTKHTKLSLEEPVEMDAGAFWPRQEKEHHVHTAPIEADAHVVHELDGSEVPELPGNFEGQMLANKKTPRTSCHAGDDNMYTQELPHQWIDWTPPLADAQSCPKQEHTRHSNLYLEVMPSHQATSVSPIVGSTLYTSSQNASFSVSPIAPSPLEGAHLSLPRSGQTQQQRYYHHTMTST